MLAEIGFAAALLVRELDDGSLEIIDGHLRAETAPDALVPVLVLDVDEVEADKLLATFDLLPTMAGTNVEKLYSLVADVDTGNDAVRRMLDQQSQRASQLHDLTAPAKVIEKAIPEVFQVVVRCRDEADQEVVFERLTGDGYVCKISNL